MSNVDVEYLKRAPHGGNRYVGSEYSRQQMIAAGHEIERLRAAQVGARVGAENETREALIADALEAFQKRDGYHKEVIVELLQDFGAALLDRAAVGACVGAGAGCTQSDH